MTTLTSWDVKVNLSTAALPHDVNSNTRVQCSVTEIYIQNLEGGMGEVQSPVFRGIGSHCDIGVGVVDGFLPVHGRDHRTAGNRATQGHVISVQYGIGSLTGSNSRCA